MNRAEIEIGRFKHFGSIIKSNWGSMLRLNLMFFLFIVPIMAVIFFIIPVLENKFITDNGFNFVGDLGLGFTGATNDTSLALHGIYMLRIYFYLLLIPGMALAGVGASGLFYCMRNKVWGANVKIKTHFFRGIKKYWWKFMTAFAFIGAVGYGVAGSINAYFLFSINATAPWWIWIVMIFACLLALATALFMFMYLANVTMYRIKYRHTIKNSIILAFVTGIAGLIIFVMMALPTLLYLSGITKIILLVFFGLYGFAFYALAIQCFGQYAADAFPNAVYKLTLEEEERSRRRKANQEKKKTRLNKGKKR